MIEQASAVGGITASVNASNIVHGFKVTAYSALTRAKVCRWMCVDKALDGEGL